jgi:hypothetical protein
MNGAQMTAGDLPGRTGPGRRGVLSVTVAAAFVTTAAVRYLSIVGFTNDHYEHLAGAQQMLASGRRGTSSIRACP